MAKRNDQDFTTSAPNEVGTSPLTGDTDRKWMFRSATLAGGVMSFLLVLTLASSGSSAQSCTAAKDHINTPAERHIKHHIHTAAKQHIKDHIEQHI